MDSRKRKKKKAPSRRRRRKTLPVIPDAPVTAETVLTFLERRFVEQYMVDGNGAQAFLRAGGGGDPENAAIRASQLLSKLNVAAALHQMRAAQALRTQITADGELRDTHEAANLDLVDCMDAHGNWLPYNEWPTRVRKHVQSVKVVKRNVTNGDGETDWVLEVTLTNKAKMREILARATGLYKGEVPGEHDYAPAFALPPGTTGVSVH
ncbi:MAG TPA: terminase small subunit [Vicinamibacterales bacterium]|jgi:phage terminase small subunit|nr:terminase small subunit [Vicinamibacterales bacterium]